jgi:hypothetical protein
MFRRIFRIPAPPNPAEWLFDEDVAEPIPHGDAASLPMHTWDASKGVRALVETDETVQMPPVYDDSAEVSVMRWQPTDEDVTGWALRNLKRLSPETLAAGLRAYVQQHPVTA